MPVCRMLVEERKSNEHVEFCFAAAAEAVSCDARSVLSLVTHSDGSQKRSLIISDCRRCSLLLESQFHDGGVAAFIVVGAQSFAARRWPHQLGRGLASRTRAWK